MLTNTKPAKCRLQYSSTWTVPSKLWSTRVREGLSPVEAKGELGRASRPARTLGFAAQSITQWQAGNERMALRSRRSASMTVAPRHSRGRRFCSLPGRQKLSTRSTSQPSLLRKNLVSSDPTNPHPPVISSRMIHSAASISVALCPYISQSYF